jgi:quinol monooxygenase YgiN
LRLGPAAGTVGRAARHEIILRASNRVATKTSGLNTKWERNTLMSTLVTNELFAQPGRGDDVANLLLEILGESLQHDGCETVRIVRDQDDPDHVAGVTQWTERRNFEDYLAWRTERGFSGTFEAMLTRPFVIHYYDIAYFGEGIAARQSIQP